MMKLNLRLVANLLARSSDARFRDWQGVGTRPIGVGIGDEEGGAVRAVVFHPQDNAEEKRGQDK